MAEEKKDQEEPQEEKHDPTKDPERTGEAERQRQDEEKAAAVRERQYRQGHVERAEEEPKKERKKNSE